MKFTLSQKILAGFTICTVILISVAVFSFKNSDKFVSSNQWVNHTYEVLGEFDQVLASTIDAETGARGFAVSGNDVFLEPYNTAHMAVYAHLDKVQNLTIDNPAQQKNIDLLRKQVDVQEAHLSEIIDLRRKNNFEGAKDLIASGKGKQLQDDIRNTIGRCKTMENNLLAERKKESEDDARNFNVIFSVLLLVIGLVLISVYMIIDTNLKALKKAESESADKNWLLSGSFELNEKTRGEQAEKELAQAVIIQLCTYLKAQIGAVYLIENGHLQLYASYAFHGGQETKHVIQIGEGLVGQAAKEKKAIVFDTVPGDYIKVNSSLGSVSPKNIIVFPLLQDDSLKGVIEIGSVHVFSNVEKQFLNMVGENLAIIFSAAQSRTKMKELLEETQRQAEELETQQEELKQSNEELLEKTELLEKSESQLKVQQEELQQANEELEEKANLLEDQKERLESAKKDIENKAKELEGASKYKSEFLANMSHELRTPLNSILILSQLLTENKSKLLGEKEIEYSQIIYNSGSDLLSLINEILDLSKVEAGKMDIDIEQITFEEIKNEISAMFTEVAKSKSIDFEIKIDTTEIGETIHSDKQRLEQILRNLLSNAFKFTEKGGKVSVSMSKASANAKVRDNSLQGARPMVAFSVRDSGIGIPADKLNIVFEAFQQADGSTKRKYGGTGLGLSISRELAGALGGEISVESEEGIGSVFTLYLPGEFSPGISESPVPIETNKIKIDSQKEATEKTETFEEEAKDDRYNIKANDKAILIMEDDPQFATYLLHFVNGKGYKGIVALKGNTGLSLARHYKPDAIMLDMNLPVVDGTEVLKQLKNDPELRHIPVQVISGYDMRKEGMELGAFDYIRKPISKDDLQNAFGRIEEFISRKLKRLLIVEDDENHNKAIRELIGNGDVKCFSAYSGQEALDMMRKEHYDCAIVDLGLPDMPGVELLEKIKTDSVLNKTPIVVYTGRNLTKEENGRLNKLASAVVLKTADSHERLLDETILFLHRVESKLPKEKQNIIRKLHKTEEVLKDRKVLIVDDDIRNIYSLTNALEQEGVHCFNAENGRLAIETLEATPGIDIILMDVMMPEMDGYEATREIRSMHGFSKIPIIALTAKAMKGDREKCLNAGMSDYVSKPVNIEQLLSLMRVWLYR